jgi:hypothetical protein
MTCSGVSEGVPAIWTLHLPVSSQHVRGSFVGACPWRGVGTGS